MEARETHFAHPVLLLVQRDPQKRRPWIKKNAVWLVITSHLIFLMRPCRGGTRGCSLSRCQDHHRTGPGTPSWKQRRATIGAHACEPRQGYDHACDALFSSSKGSVGECTLSAASVFVPFASPEIAQTLHVQNDVPQLPDGRHRYCTMHWSLIIGSQGFTYNTEVQQTRPLLFRRAPIATWVTQISIGHLVTYHRLSGCLWKHSLVFMSPIWQLRHRVLNLPSILPSSTHADLFWPETQAPNFRSSTFCLPQYM